MAARYHPNRRKKIRSYELEDYPDSSSDAPEARLFGPASETEAFGEAVFNFWILG